MESPLMDDQQRMYSSLDLHSLLFDHSEASVCDDSIEHWPLEDDCQKCTNSNNVSNNLLILPESSEDGNSSQYYVVPTAVGNSLPDYNLVPETVPDSLDVDNDIDDVGDELLLPDICDQKGGPRNDYIANLLADSLGSSENETLVIPGQNGWVNLGLCNEVHDQLDVVNIRELMNKIDIQKNDILVPESEFPLDFDTDDTTLKEVRKVYKKRSKNVVGQLTNDRTKKIDVGTDNTNTQLNGGVCNEDSRKIDQLLSGSKLTCEESDKLTTKNSSNQNILSKNVPERTESKSVVKKTYSEYNSNDLLIENAVLLAEIEKLQEELSKVREERDQYKEKVKVPTSDATTVTDTTENRNAVDIPISSPPTQTSTIEVKNEFRDSRSCAGFEVTVLDSSAAIERETCQGVSENCASTPYPTVHSSDKNASENSEKDIVKSEVIFPDGLWNSEDLSSTTEQLSSESRPKRRRQMPAKYRSSLLEPEEQEEDSLQEIVIDENSLKEVEVSYSCPKSEYTPVEKFKIRPKDFCKNLMKVRRTNGENILNSSEEKDSDSDSVQQRKNINTCKVCGKQFSKQSELHIHYELHSWERPFVCNVCNASFKTANVLKTHKRLHTGNKFRCALCNKAYVAKSGLQIHMRYHMNQKPFMCKFCGKCFRHSGHLTEHERLHTGEKPYRCHVCRRSFPNCGNLYKHMRSVHKCNNPKEILGLYEMNDNAEPVYVPDEQFGVLPRFTEACAS